MKSPTNLILIILSLALFYTFTSPEWADVKVLQTSAHEYSNVLENVSQITETRDRLLVDYAAIPRSELQRLSKTIPDNVDTVRLALDLDNIAARYGVAIKEVKVETKADPNAALAVLPDHSLAYEKATVTFSFISNYQNFRRLVSDLEKSLRIMDIKAVSFKTSESGLYEHEVKVETYWLK